MIDAEYMVQEINRLDIPHRRGWLPSENSEPYAGAHLDDEVSELLDALQSYESTTPEGTLRPIAEADVKQEMGDVFACLLQIAYRFGWSFEEINQEAVRKLRLRFLGADQIQIPRRQNDTQYTPRTLCSDSLLYKEPHNGSRRVSA